MTKLLSMYEKQDRPELPAYPGGPAVRLDCDVAVIGGGGSGLAAAVRAAQKGARVVVVEKMDVLGGNSRFAGGLLSTSSRFQRELGMPDMTEEYYKQAYHLNKYTLDPAIFRRYIRNTGVFLEWLADLGLDTDNIRFAMGAVAMVKERKDPGYLNNPMYGPGLMGSTVLDVLTRALEPLPVQVLTSTKAERLLTDEAGRVTGLTAKGQQASYEIRANSVILSAGGFGANPALLRRFLPKYFSRDNYCAHYCLLSTTGDGILMAEQAGAEVGRNISVGLEGISHIPGTYSVQSIARSPKMLIVNRDGRRFIAEDDTEDAEFAMDLQPDGLAFLIFDAAAKSVIYQEAVDNARFDPMTSREQLEADLIQEDAEGKCRIASTMAEAARFIGCTEQALAATIEQYNQMCGQGRDRELFKDKAHLIPVRQFPLCILRCQRKFDVTMGGVSIDRHLRALTPEGRPIGGLYVTGDGASNWMGEEYGPLFSSFAWAMNSGYLAAEEAAAE